MSCVVRGCNENKGAKAIMCPKHWTLLPQNLRDELRQGTETGIHSLRANPTREWLASASKHVGEMRNLIIRVDASNKVKRQFQKPDDPAAPKAA